MLSSLNHFIKIIKGHLIRLKDITACIVGKCTQSKIWPWCWYPFWIVFLAITILGGFKKSARGLPDTAYIILMVIIVSLVRRMRPRLIRKWPYFREKPSAPYIMLFMILLLSCAFLLMIKLEPVAEQVANIAYFLLVIGVGIEFYQLMREKKDKKEELPAKQTTENQEKT